MSEQNSGLAQTSTPLPGIPLPLAPYTCPFLVLSVVPLFHKDRQQWDYFNVNTNHRNPLEVLSVQGFMRQENS